MCAQSLEKIVLDKFNALNPHWKAQNLKDLREEIRNEIRENRAQTQDIIAKYKALLDSIKICDPSVGSGHFLVSALNEMIAIHYKLDLLRFYKNAESASAQSTSDLSIEYDLELQNDEVIIFTRGRKFAYTKPKSANEEAHIIQKGLFNLKRAIIENNLFGVDINPNSCEISRLRLWIELLKNAYYLDFEPQGFNPRFKSTHQLHTLPNIDINIKCGNSLVSRFDLKDSLTKINNIKKQIEDYKKLVSNYRMCDRMAFDISKTQIEEKIEKIKQAFQLTLKDEKTTKELQKLIERHIALYGKYMLDDESLLDGLQVSAGNLFGDDPVLTENQEEEAAMSYAKIKLLRKRLDSLKSGEIYKNALEWRFEFPEVLDSNGDFLGFDLVIGNPPYMQVPKKVYSAQHFPYSEGKDIGKQNTYKVFIELGYNLAKEKCGVWLIVQSSLMCDMSAKHTRELLLKNTQLNQFLEFPKNIQIFTGVTQGVCIVGFKKQNPDKNQSFNISIHNDKESIKNPIFETITQKEILDFFPTAFEIPLIKKGEASIVNKLKKHKVLKELLIDSAQGNINTIHLKRIKSDTKTNCFIAKGANVHRYYLDKNLMYAKITTETEKISQKNSQNFMLAIQNITGTSDKNRIHCCFVECKNTKFVFLHSANIIYLQNASNAIFVLGLLNSKLLDWLFRKTSTNNHVNMYELESLPIPKIDSSNKKIADKIIKLVEQILEQKAQDSTFDTSALESEIDSLVYKLYNLTESEIKTIES